MEKITGRTDDMMIIRGVNVFPTQIEELILKIPQLAPHYLCELSREGPLDALTVRVEQRQNASASDLGTYAARLVEDIKSYVGVTAKVIVQTSGSIERSAGKAKRVVDLRSR